jgi:S1-C subfamily serine protease
MPTLHTRPHASRTQQASHRAIRLLATCIVLLATAFAVKPAAALDREAINQALRASVQVIVPDNDFETFSLGSGTVLTAGGLILTNYHVVEGDRRNGLLNDDGLVGIAVIPADLRGEAILKYEGAVVKTSPELDLALVQITGLVDDPDAPLPANLGLTPISLGNSDDLLIGDEINMFGFPGVGGNTPTLTDGIVSGFLDEDRNGDFEWIKTDALISHGNSGGLATDSTGRFIGVPTAGNVDEMGAIGLVRTGNLAIQFFQSHFPGARRDGANITKMEYSEAINRRGQPLNPSVTFASGITDLYAVFDFAGFEDGVDFTYVWYLDGGEILRDSFAWDLGESGSTWLSIYNEEGLDDGFTEVEILYDGASIYRGGVMVGEGSAPEPPPVTDITLSPITFAEDVSGDMPVGAGTTFSGVGEVFAFFDYAGMSNGLPWMTRWYLDGQMILEDQQIWNFGEEGSNYVSLYHPDGLPAGQYSLELYVDGNLLQEGSFSIQAGSSVDPAAVNLIGVVLDRNNRRQAVSGALIVLLQPGVSVDDWIDADFADDMVHGSGTSNRSGDFQLDATVVPGEYYSVVVVHDDYEPITVDDYQIPPDTPNPYELEVTMDRS